MRPGRLWLLGLVVSLALAFPLSSAKAQEPPRVDKETLKSWLAASEVLIFDVRQPEDWQGSDKKIKGAVRQDPKDAKTWVASLPKDKKIVLYCSWHNEGTSARVAQQLLEMGFSQVWALKGGWKEWEKAGYPTEPKNWT